jgi:c(7)-type cytochrome triheme protein
MSFLNLKHILSLALALCLLGVPVMAGWFSDTTGKVGSWFKFSKTELKGENGVAEKRFTHVKHTEEGVGCDDCHQPNENGAMQKPGLEQCSSCHDGDDILTKDQLEGKFTWSSQSRLSKEVIFSHDTHVSAEIACLSCHKDIDKNTNISSVQWLKMKDCTTCHASEVSQEAATDCTVCHTKINKEDKPDFHGAAFMRSHGMLSRMGEGETRADCSLCHKENQCTACHSTEMPKSHNSHFTRRGHGIAASIDRESCATCHRTDTCDSCHEQTAPTNHTPTFGGSKSRHCGTCHFPQSQSECYTCHKSAPSHLSATAMPTNTAHVKASANDCRECHVAGKLKHMDNGQSCKECHR